MVLAGVSVEKSLEAPMNAAFQKIMLHRYSQLYPQIFNAWPSFQPLGACAQGLLPSDYI